MLVASSSECSVLRKENWDEKFFPRVHLSYFLTITLFHDSSEPDWLDQFNNWGHIYLAADKPAWFLTLSL